MEKVNKIIEIAIKMRKKHIDSQFIIVGDEGSGKTNLGLDITDPLGIDINDISLDKNDFLRSLSKIKEGSVFQFDEAGDGLFSRDSLSKINKDLVKTFMICRAKLLIGFFILPSFFYLDSYFRKHRIRGLFYVYRRGHVAFYDRAGINEIILKCEKAGRISGVKPLFYDTFPEYKGRLLKDYLVKKTAKIKDIMLSLDPDKEEDNRGVNILPPKIIKAPEEYDFTKAIIKERL